MKKIFLLIPLIVGVGSSAWASSCTSEALSIYEGSGFSCNIGDLVFSNFTSSGVDTTTTVTDITVPESGLDFGVDLAAVGPGNEGASIGYLVTCDGCSINDWALETGGQAPREREQSASLSYLRPECWTNSRRDLQTRLPVLALRRSLPRLRSQ